MKTIGILKDSSVFSKLTQNQSDEVVAQICAAHPIFSTILTS